MLTIADGGGRGGQPNADHCWRRPLSVTLPLLARGRNIHPCSLFLKGKLGAEKAGSAGPPLHQALCSIPAAWLFSALITILVCKNFRRDSVLRLGDSEEKAMKIPASPPAGGIWGSGLFFALALNGHNISQRKKALSHSGSQELRFAGGEYLSKGSLNLSFHWGHDPLAFGLPCVVQRFHSLKMCDCLSFYLPERL